MPSDEALKAKMDDATAEQRAAVLEILTKADGVSRDDLAEVLAFAMWNRERVAHADLAALLVEAAEMIDAADPTRDLDIDGALVARLRRAAEEIR